MEVRGVDDTGRVAIVTGGAGGIGQAINRRLAQAGWKVLAGDLAAALAENDPVAMRSPQRNST
jgi:NAD(P)-dependent dehydrogenase (short-subunit alcohol dehydrogenase family)